MSYQTNRIVVIYHKADFDGLFCREIARKFLPADAVFIGWDYGDEILAPIHDEDSLYMLDISVPQLMNHPNLIWIDHHKTAIDKYGKKNGYQIDGVAACRLTWQWFYHSNDRENVLGNQSKSDFMDRKVDEPLAVRLAGEYDIWDKRDPRAELFQHGLCSRELHADWWRGLLGAESWQYCDTLLEAGKVLQYAKTQENKSIIRAAGFDLEFEGLKFLACNHARYNSFLFTARQTPEHDAFLGFAWRGGKWTVSLYHATGKEHHDLSVIASKYGGGGHRGACGFTCSVLPFTLIGCVV